MTKGITYSNSLRAHRPLALGNCMDNGCKNVFISFFPAFRRFIKLQRFKSFACQIFLSFLYFLLASAVFFLLVVKCLCTHHHHSEYDDNTFLYDGYCAVASEEKKKNKKIASLDKKNKKNKNFCHLGKPSSLPYSCTLMCNN